jgi:5-methylthioadenosine/S-adenosylhomocysteine deaminase
MATENGAKALGFGAGTLTVGSPADIILATVHTPCNTPLHHATSNLVYSCNGGVVETTICDGRVLMLEREIPKEAVIREGAVRAAHDLVLRAQGS